MAAAFVNHAYKWIDASATTIATDAQSLTAGNLSLVGFREGNGQWVTGITDTAGNTYERLIDGNFVGGGTDYELWVAYNTLGHGSNIVTATFNTSTNSRGIATIQFSGLALVGALETLIQATPISATSITSWPFYFRSAEGVIVVFCQNDSAGLTYTPDTGYTEPGEDASGVLNWQYKIVSAPEGPSTVVGTPSSSATNRMLGAAFGGVGAGGGGGGISRSRVQRGM